MINASKEFRELLLRDERKFVYQININLLDGTPLQLSNNKIWSSGLKFSDAVSSGSNFEIGSAIIGKFTFSINNIYGEFSEYDFSGATVRPKVGLILPDGTTEMINKGVYIVDEPSYNGTIITLECLDNISKLDRAYSESNLKYPATIDAIIRDICSVCDVPLGSFSVDGSSRVIQERPNDESITCREVLQWCAQILCKYCRCNINGQLELLWYDQEVFENFGNKNLYGGNFSDYKTGDDANGGNFSPWDIGYVYNSGDFSKMNYHHIYSLSSLQVSTDDVIITGIRVIEENDSESGAEETIYLSGKEGYILEISGNNLIKNGDGNYIASDLAQKLVGLRFRVFNCSHINDPTIEAGDAIVISDRKNISYISYITETEFSNGEYQKTSCGAESPEKNSSQRYSEYTKIYVDYRKGLKKERADREKALEELGNRIDNSSGTFTTSERQQDGSYIYYLHNKPSLEDSDIVWKMTAEAWAVSTNGGKTWNAGMTVDGDTITRILTAVGVSCDWIKGGELVLGGSLNKNGIMKILDYSGEEIGRWSNLGIVVNKGSIYSKTSTTGASIYGGRLHMTHGDTDVGYIGTNSFEGYSSYKGLVFDLEDTGAYMTWAAKESSSSTNYLVKLLYANKSFSSYVRDNLYLGCDINMNGYSLKKARFSGEFTIPNNVSTNIYSDMDMHNFDIKNVKLENIVAINGYTPADGTFPVVTSISDNGDGTISWRYGNVTIRDGVITSWPR